MRLGFSGLININIIAAHCWQQIKLSEITHQQMPSIEVRPTASSHPHKLDFASAAPRCTSRRASSHVTMESYYYGHQSILIGRLRPLVYKTHFCIDLWPRSMTLTLYHRRTMVMTHVGYMHKIKVRGQLVENVNGKRSPKLLKQTSF